ncbi:DNA mismatch repair protein MutT [Rhizocola hellebori]|uniref:DNA mismatch repair protein MutT n=1 Tax=Rhizocola hellebori TaxID=1392758 RepID=A0A8J3QHC5_9ACTN|nr:NUDIX hydrolase [Rhizocola hellebori]GIH09725.1 DNA mismatch repair protein MutT [Rhizocola hellebori]
MTATVRKAIADLVRGIAPHDASEEHDRQLALDWIDSGAQLHRTAKPDVPPMHLVAYFAVTDSTGAMLLADHLKSGLLLPPGGHCEAGELPWDTVRRECPEELGIDAVAAAAFGPRPLFVTVTRTRDPHGLGGIHTDVSLWHVVRADRDSITGFDRNEFSAVHWLTTGQIQALPLSGLDPAMHRFAAKYQHRLGQAAQDHGSSV